jgi:hypothetical protein
VFSEELVVLVERWEKLTISFDPYVKVFGWWRVNVYPYRFAAGGMMDGVDTFSGNSLCSGNFETRSYDDEEIRRRSRSNVCIGYRANGILSSVFVCKGGAYSIRIRLVV